LVLLDRNQVQKVVELFVRVVINQRICLPRVTKAVIYLADI